MFCFPCYGLMRPADVIERAHFAATRSVELAPENSDSNHSVALWTTLYGSDRSSAVIHWGKVVVDKTICAQVRCSYAIWCLGLLGGNYAAAVDEICRCNCTRSIERIRV